MNCNYGILAQGLSSHSSFPHLWTLLIVILGTTFIFHLSLHICSILIHAFNPQSLRHSSPSSPSSSITALVQSPAVDIVGIGFASGEVSIYDIRADERLIGVNMGSGLGGGGDTGRITSLGFRSDGEPILATASSNGHIAFWDLNGGGKLLNVLRGAHEGAVTALEWIPGQPLMISCGVDNSVKVSSQLWSDGLASLGFSLPICPAVTLFLGSQPLNDSNGFSTPPPNLHACSNSEVVTNLLLTSSDTTAPMENRY